MGSVLQEGIQSVGHVKQYIERQAMHLWLESAFSVVNPQSTSEGGECTHHQHILLLVLPSKFPGGRV